MGNAGSRYANTAVARFANERLAESGGYSGTLRQPGQDMAFASEPAPSGCSLFHGMGRGERLPV